MECKDLERIVLASMPEAQVSVSGSDGKYQVAVVSTQFAGLNILDRHRLVYSTVKEQIANGTVHALSIEARSPQENDDEPNSNS